MKKASALLIILIFGLAGISGLSGYVQPVKATSSDWTWTETIYIRTDGSIYPATAPIISTDNVTYTLTDNIIGNVSEGSSAIIIERENITIDGAGHTVQSTALTVSSRVRSNGIYLSGTGNVTIKDINVNGFWFGIYLNQTSYNTIFGNNITKCGLPWSRAYAATQGNGIYLESCSGNSISGNNVTNSNYGIHLESSSDNTISGNNITNNGVGIWLESSSGNSISGNNIASNGDGSMYDGSCGISLSSSSNYNSVSGNNITHTAHGIGLSSSSYNNISDNNITTNTNQYIFSGIYLESSSYNTISGNNVTNNGFGVGVYLESSFDNSVSENEFVNNGLYLHISDNNSVENNTVNGRPLVYLEDVSNRTVEDAGQVILVKCENIRVEGLNLSRTIVGVELSETNNSTISGNNMTNNWWGIYSDSSSNNSIFGNNITNNVYSTYLDSSSGNSISDNNITNNWTDIHLSYVCGIYLDSSSYNTISGNNVTNNEENIYLVSNVCGIRFDSSSNNSIFHNNFVNNTIQVFSSNSTNIWHDGYPSGGNYWSDYSDFDFYSGPYQNETGSDEIWDHPYVIDENNTDNYPIVPEFPSILILPLFMMATLLAVAAYGRKHPQNE